MIDMEKVIKGLESLHRRLLDAAKRDSIAMLDAIIVSDALVLLKAQEARHRLEVHNIGNVDIPEGVSWEQFHAVMNNVVAALEHTDRGESWPYEETKA